MRCRVSMQQTMDSQGRTHPIRILNSPWCHHSTIGHLQSLLVRLCTCVWPGLTNLGRHHKFPAGIIHQTLLCPPLTYTTHINTHILNSKLQFIILSQVFNLPSVPFAPLCQLHCWYYFTSASSHLRPWHICMLCTHRHTPACTHTHPPTHPQT